MLTVFLNLAYFSCTPQTIDENGLNVNGLEDCCDDDGEILPPPPPPPPTPPGNGG